MAAKWLARTLEIDDALNGTLNAHVDQVLAEDERARGDLYADTPRLWPADWLSASRLAQPLQWQVLKALGVPAREPDTYAYRLFKRGRDVEDWFVSTLRLPHQEQVPVTYRDTVGGYIDVLMTVDGVEIPWEVKSVKNSKYSRIKKQGADRSHILQAAMYGLARGTTAFSVIYIAADDLRILPFTDLVENWRPEVDRLCDRFTDWKTLFPGQVPVFEPEEGWQASRDGVPSKYSAYPDWAHLDAAGLAAKVKEVCP